MISWYITFSFRFYYYTYYYSFVKYFNESSKECLKAARSNDTIAVFLRTNLIHVIYIYIIYIHTHYIYIYAYTHIYLFCLRFSGRKRLKINIFTYVFSSIRTKSLVKAARHIRRYDAKIHNCWTLGSETGITYRWCHAAQIWFEL